MNTIQFYLLPQLEVKWYLTIKHTKPLFSFIIRVEFFHTHIFQAIMRV